jgi:hypothetical protein
MLYFHTKNANYSKLWDEKVLLFRGKLVFLLPFVIFVPILVHFSHFGFLHEEKSGNPAKNATAANTHVAKAGFDAKKGRHLVTIFCDFRQFSSKKIGVFLKKIRCCDPILAKSVSFYATCFGENILKVITSVKTLHGDFGKEIFHGSRKKLTTLLFK